jgi:hypothetical protein
MPSYGFVDSNVRSLVPNGRCSVHPGSYERRFPGFTDTDYNAAYERAAVARGVMWRANRADYRPCTDAEYVRYSKVAEMVKRGLIVPQPVSSRRTRRL